MKARITLSINKNEYKLLKKFIETSKNKSRGIDFADDRCVLVNSCDPENQDKLMIEPLICKIELENKKFKEKYRYY